MSIELTVIIPSYNDAAGLAKVLPDLINDTQEQGWRIIVVNDGSTDDTTTILKQYAEQITIVNNEHNMGYGASLKRGIWIAATEWIATMDADGQHRLQDLKNMAQQTVGYDAVIGSRVSASHAPLSRRPGKWFLRKMSHLLTGHNVSDLNCGLRILRREIMLHLFSITSDRFSFSTSTTVALMQLGCRVNFFPVLIAPRVGKSTVRQVRDGFDTLLRITRLVFLFHPLRIVLPVGLLLLLAGFVRGVYEVLVYAHLSSSTQLLAICGVIIFFMALLADQVAGLRRDILLRDLRQMQLNDCSDTDGRDKDEDTN